MKIKFSISIMVAVLAVTIAAFARPRAAEAKIMSMAFLGFLNLDDYSTKESSFAFAFNSSTDEQDKIEAERQDKIDRINAYYNKRNMPLEGYGEDLLVASEKCGMDWRLLPAIGVRESSGGKNQFNNNPFGWGSAKIKFKDFSDAIKNVGEHLCGDRETTARYYKDKTTMEKLWYYNGTVIASYPAEVVEIMEMF